MRINNYSVRLGNDDLNVLVKEKSQNYKADFLYLNNYKDITKMINDVYDLEHMAEEHLFMLSMNARGKLIGVFEVSHGTVSSTLANPREIYIRALLSGAHHIVCVHNHPSGDIEPSNEDIENYKYLCKVGDMIGIPIVDSIIVGNGTALSIAIQLNQ